MLSSKVLEYTFQIAVTFYRNWKDKIPGHNMIASSKVAKVHKTRKDNILNDNDISLV